MFRAGSIRCVAVCSNLLQYIAGSTAMTMVIAISITFVCMYVIVLVCVCVCVCVCVRKAVPVTVLVGLHGRALWPLPCTHAARVHSDMKYMCVCKCICMSMFVCLCVCKVVLRPVSLGLHVYAHLYI